MATAIKKNRWLFVLVIGFVLILGFLTLDRLMPARIPSTAKQYEPYCTLHILKSGNWIGILDPSERLTPVQGGETYLIRVQGMLVGAEDQYISGERGVTVKEKILGTVLAQKTGSDKVLEISITIPVNKADGFRYSVYGYWTHGEVRYGGYIYSAGTKEKFGELIVGAEYAGPETRYAHYNDDDDVVYDPIEEEQTAKMDLLPVFLAVGLIILFKKKRGEKPSLKR